MAPVVLKMPPVESKFAAFGSNISPVRSKFAPFVVKRAPVGPKLAPVGLKLSPVDVESILAPVVLKNHLLSQNWRRLGREGAN